MERSSFLRQAIIWENATKFSYATWPPCLYFGGWISAVFIVANKGNVIMDVSRIALFMNVV